MGVCSVSDTLEVEYWPAAVELATAVTAERILSRESGLEKTTYMYVSLIKTSRCSLRFDSVGTIPRILTKQQRG